MFWRIKRWWERRTQQKKLAEKLSDPTWFQYTTFQDLATADSVVVIEPCAYGYVLTIWKDRFFTTHDGGLWFGTVHAALRWARVRGL